MPSAENDRRLRDAENADPGELTAEQVATLTNDVLSERFQQVCDGLAALQSTDEPPFEQVADLHERLMRGMELMRDELKKRGLRK